MWLLSKPNESWAYIKNFISEAEADQIITYGDAQTLELSGMGTDQKTSGFKDSSIRSSEQTWINPNSELRWLYERTNDAVNDINNRFFEYEISWFEQFQFTRYHESLKGQYKGHIDCGYNYADMRKLSFVLMLSEPKDYRGGDLKLFHDKQGRTMPNDRCTALFFPSYVLHEVTPVKRGVRYTLVTWIHGPKFR